ncbi:hypothetical protein OC846_002997 [Tilletia horrida]|uniref:Velvet domain-containing protein n=1 Tax=Tilletia horrida TaxID=155126 RepID=A0AAN6JS46_9BASI|nr:hypothetical protein OC846_002997 [Tilletia horrida]
MIQAANTEERTLPETSVSEVPPSAEELVAAAPPGSSLKGFSRTRNGLRYELVVVQQPSRARMCGFGDKDRRPLSPTLIAKLLIYDAASGRELHPSEVNTSLFFVTSDLVHPDHLTLGPRNVLIHHGGHMPGAFGQQSGPSPSGDESVVSAVLDTGSPSQSHIHFDPHTQSHVFSATPFISQPILSVGQSSHSSDTPHQSWAHIGPATGSFLPAPPYTMPDLMGSDAGTSIQNTNFLSYPTSPQDGSVSFAIATGMAGAFHPVDQPQTPSSAGFPPQMGNMGPGAGPGAGTSMASFDYTSGPPTQSPMGPHSGTLAAAAPNLSQSSGSSTSNQPQTFPVGAVYPPTTALSAVSLTQNLSSDNLTRNLVGSAVASANVLKDLDNRVCIFFVLQDISVRTEGIYRIKLMFADLGLNGTVNRGISEALAETFTDAFIVYSPRRFPGMHDPPELSRKLVSQGVKIPVRSDRKKRSRTRTGESSIGGATGSVGTGGGGWAGADVSAGSGVAAADDDADDDDEDDD